MQGLFVVADETIVAHVAGPEGSVLVLKARDKLLELEGDSAEAVQAVIALLAIPRSRDDLAEALGNDVVDEVLPYLIDIGAVRSAPTGIALPAHPGWATALAKGVRILAGAGGAAQLAEGVSTALAAAGIDAATVERAAPSSSPGAGGSAWIAVFHVLDPAFGVVVQAARANGALLFPILWNAPYVYAGPPAQDDRACGRCTLLRLLAHVSPVFHATWSRLQTSAALVEAARFAEARHVDYAARAAVTALLGTDVDGRIAGVVDPVVRIDPRSGSVDAHQVLRHAHCVACGPRPPSSHIVDRGRLDAEREEVRARWRTILSDDPESLRPDESIARLYQDRVVGVNMYAEDWTQAPNYFRKMPECWGGIAIVREHEFVSTGLQGINGTGPNLDHVRLVSLSEGLERYAQYTHRPAWEDIAYQDVRDHALDPRALALYQEEQYALPRFPRPRFREDSKLKWSWGYGMISGEPRLLPVEVVTVNIRDSVYPGRIISQELTTGGASHVSYTRALLNAFRELVERDALMIAWYKRMELPRVEMPRTTGDAYTDDLYKYLVERGVELEIYDMRLDLPIPSFLVIGRVTRTQMAFEVGGTVGAAASDLDPAVALGRALGEMRIHYETLALTSDAMKDWRNYPYDPHSPDEGFGNWWPNYVYYLNPANRRAFDFLNDSRLQTRWEEIRSCASGDPTRDRDFLIQMFHRAGLEPYAWDLVNDEVAPSGFRIVKVEVPGIIHLVPGRQSRRLGSPRFEAVAAQMGRRCLPPGEINPDTHVQA